MHIFNACLSNDHRYILLKSCIKRLFICLTMAALYIACVLIFAYLANHVIEKKQAESELESGIHCVGKESCASAYFKTSGDGKGLCELNRKPQGHENSERL